MKKRQVVFGFLGSTLDSAPIKNRWDKWRPTIGLCQQEDLVVDKLVLFYQDRSSILLKTVVADLKDVSPETTVRAVPMELKDPWDLEEVYTALLEFSKTYYFDLSAEDYFVHITTGTHIIQICLYLLVEAKFFPAQLIQTSPPRGRAGNIGTYSVIDLDISKYDRIWSRFQKDKTEAVSFLKSGIDTKNTKFNELISEIEQVAVVSKAPILLSGPTGAGKSHLAKKIFELKKQKHQVQGEFVEVNCATLRGDAAMSTLFGHVKGSFTGAAQDRHGLLKKANQGLLFLDEIGELGLDEQAMLLRAIEEKKFFPFGSDKEITSDFQLIAGTNRDLPAQVKKHKFREDLLARINLWAFQLPSLAERREDIAPNLEFELDRFCTTNHLRIRMNTEAKARFLTFAEMPDSSWNGNFRDLYSAVFRMASLSKNGVVNSELVDKEIARLRTGWKQISKSQESAADSSRVTAILGNRAEEYDEFDLLQLEEVLRVCQNSKNLSSAGRRLFQISRTQKKAPNDADRLVKYLARFGLSWSDLN